MVMEIQFLDKARSQNVTRFQMRSVDDGWALPEVILAPVDKLPHVCRLAVAVTGTPTVVAGRIQASFYSREFNPPSPLSERKAIGGGLVRDAGPLPADAVCDLTVTVGYKDSDGRGRPTGKEHTLTSTCKLFSTPLPEQPPEIEVEQREGKIVVLGEEARIVLKVRYARDERPPTLALEYPSTVLSPDDASSARLAAVLPDLRDGLVAALGVTPQRQEVAGDRVVFHMNFRPTLAQATRNALEQLGEPLVIALVATLPQAKPVRCLVKLEPKKVQFNGWLVIDLGTTNSSVTVYDDRGKTPQEGLHPEQEEVLRGLLSGWLAEPASEAMHDGRRFETDWKRLRDLLKPAGAVGRPAADDIASGPAVHFYEAQARLELALRGMREEFRRAVSVRLHEFYHEALRTPTLRMKNIYPVQLSPGRDQKDIPSDVEVRELGEVVGVTMGEQARAAHMEAIGAAATDGIRAIESRFHASPKRYFGTEHEPFRVTIGDRTQYVSTDQLMQAGWRELVAQTERARAEDRRFSHGAFRSAVITYPTVAPPVVRQRIRGLIERLGITDVRTDYDEAVAAAIFYFVREYGGAPEIGLESFRARSSQALSKEGSHQNVLVFDIGGGTTDVALIQLRLTEEPVFEPGEDRGAGGRFYKITPKLLCSSGHLQLGGELITLHIFRLLKAVLADHILTLVQDGKLRSDHFKAMLTDDAATEFVDEKRRYKPDSIVKQFLKNETNIDVINTSEALDLAELVLPTRWDRPAAHPETAPVQAFYALWELADRAKMALGGRVEGGGGPPPFLIEQEQFRKLLDQCVPGQRYQCADPARNLCVRLTADQVEGAIGKTVMDAVKIAKGALTKLPDGEKLDWLILSGKSCHLAKVDVELRKTFQEKNTEPENVKFVWNNERVTFEPRYAKLATSIGACLAEYYRRYKAPPRDSKHLLRRGMNMLHFAIDNLFSYLPCSFLLQTGDGDDPLFTALDELYEIEINPGDPRGKKRTDWMGRPLQLTVRRVDYPGGDFLRWVYFSTQTLVDELGLQESTWQESIKVQFEIDHRLNFDVLFCRFGKDEQFPHYRLTEREPQLDLAAALTRLAAEPVSPDASPAGPGAGADAAPAAFGTELGWTIGYTISDQETEPTTLFKSSTAFVNRLHLPEPDKRVKAGIVLPKATVEKFSDNNRLKIYGQRPGSTEWKHLGEIERPAKTTFNCQYQFSLDEGGVLRLHPGLVPYWETLDKHELVEQPGRVYRVTMKSTSIDAESKRNPFSGMH